MCGQMQDLPVYFLKRHEMKIIHIRRVMSTGYDAPLVAVAVQSPSLTNEVSYGKLWPPIASNLEIIWKDLNKEICFTISFIHINGGRLQMQSTCIKFSD